MKPLIIVLVALIAAGGIWWITTDGENTAVSTNTDAASTVTTQPAVSTNAQDTDATEADIDTSNNVLSDDNASVDQSSESSAVDTTPETTTDSPFAVVEGEVRNTLPVNEPADVSQPQTPSTASAEGDGGGDGDSTQRTLEPVVVPSSYPVTDAEKYFIPKDERGPGRLGGPPPLDFPGGPSDPNRDGNTPFQPPVAPGQ